jgi:hypothetical protein
MGFPRVKLLVPTLSLTLTRALALTLILILTLTLALTRTRTRTRPLALALVLTPALTPTAMATFPQVDFARCWRVIVDPGDGRPASGLAVSRAFGDQVIFRV